MNQQLEGRIKSRILIPTSHKPFFNTLTEFQNLEDQYDLRFVVIRQYNYGRMAYDENFYVIGIHNNLYRFTGSDKLGWYLPKDIFPNEEDTEIEFSIEENLGINFLPQDYLKEHWKKIEQILKFLIK